VDNRLTDSDWKAIRYHASKVKILNASLMYDDCDESKIRSGIYKQFALQAERHGLIFPKSVAPSSGFAILMADLLQLISVEMLHLNFDINIYSTSHPCLFAFLSPSIGGVDLSANSADIEHITVALVSHVPRLKRL
jgi:hypothetical protein